VLTFVSVVADHGYVITTSELLHGDTTARLHTGGKSGYPPDFRDMHGIFVGYGTLGLVGSFSVAN